MHKRQRFLVVGSGYRSEYYGRVAAAWPELFEAMFLCRSEEKAERIRRNTGARAGISVEECLAYEPDFVIVAVDYGHIAEVSREWALRGFAVVCETPAGACVEDLHMLWDLQENHGARIVCCEQYHRHPVLARGCEAVKEGVIGRPLSAYLSLLHDYHAASLLRRMLLTAGERYTLRGQRFEAETTETDSRYGAVLDGSRSLRTRDIVHVVWDSGRTAVYDFSSLQYRTFIRTRHLIVRGDRGEWCDNEILYADSTGRPDRTMLLPALPKRYECLDTQYLRDIRRTYRFELAPDTQQDEYAIASILLDMEDYMAGGPSPYPLWEALDDAYFSILLKKAVETPWQEIRAEKQPWQIDCPGGKQS